MAADPALAPAPVARGQIVQDLRQSVPAQCFGDALGGVVVGKEILHSLETSLRRGGETVHEVELAPEEAQVGCKFWHVRSVKSRTLPQRAQGSQGHFFIKQEESRQRLNDVAQHPKLTG